MNEQNQFDRTDAELEALLRATFSNEARAKVSDARPVPPFPETERIATVHPLRRRWVGFSLVAAALVAVVAGASVIATEAMHSERKPVPPATSGPPTPAVSTPAPTGSTSPTGTPTTSTPPAVTTKQVSAHGVTVTVPSTWGIQPLQQGPDYGMSRTCISADPTATPIEYEARRCALVVFVSDDYPNNPLDSTNYDVALVKECGADNAALTPLSEDARTIGGQPAEHRTWSTSCLPSLSVETWTVLSWPQVQFTRMGTAADTATVQTVDAAVAGATLPARLSTMRGSDTGYPTAVNGNVLSVDRVTVVGSQVINNNPATYDYPITADTAIYGATTGNPKFIAMTADQLRDVVGGKTVGNFLPVDQVYVFLQTDGVHATYIQLRPRSTIS